MNDTSRDFPTGLTKAERETVIRWDEDEQVVTIWSASPVMLRKLHKLGVPVEWEIRDKGGRLHGRQFKLPLSSFRWGLARHRNLTDAQRAALSERMFLRKRAGKNAGRSPEPSPEQE